MPDVLSQDNDVMSSFFTPSSPMMTTPPSEPPPPAAATPTRQDQIQDDRRRSDEAIAAMKQSMSLEEQNLQQRQREMEPLRQRAIAQAQQPLPQPPKQQQPPATPQRQSQHDDENWLFASALLGSLAGAFTRRHQTNALAAFSGAMEGYQEGSRQKFDQNMKLWEAENKKTLETNKQAMDEYREILENRKYSMDQMSIAMQLAGQKYDDTAAIEAAKTKNSHTIAQFYDKRAEAAEKIQQSSDNLLEKRDEAVQREKTKLAVAQMRALGVQPGQEMATVDKIGRYELAPITGPRGVAIMELVSQKYPEYDIKKWFAEKYESTIPGRVKAAAETSGARIAAGREAQLGLILATTNSLIPRAAKSADAIPASQFPSLNKLLSMADREIGNPALIKLKMDTLSLEEGWAKAMNPTGQLTNYLTQRAHSVFADAYTPETYRAALEELAGILDNESAAIESYKKHEPFVRHELPPLKSSGSLGEAAAPVQSRAAAAQEKIIPGSVGRREPSGVRIGAMPPRPPVQYPTTRSPDMPIELPEGWSVKE